MIVPNILAAGLALLSSGALSANIKRAYPDSCPTDPELPASALHPATPKDQVINNASALFAWELVSVSAQGTPFASYPCNGINGQQFNPYDITCLVPDMLEPDRKDLYSEKLRYFPLNVDIIDAILTSRVGCSVSVDTRAIKQHVQMYTHDLIQALTINAFDKDMASTICTKLSNVATQSLLHSTKIRITVCDIAGMQVPNPDDAGFLPDEIHADFLMDLSKLFAWQWGGIVLDSKWVTEACTKDLDSLNSGLDMIGFNPSAFTDVFCKMFQTEPPPAGYVNSISEDLITNLWITTLFGLSNDPNYQCLLCSMKPFDQGRLENVGLNMSDVQSFVNHACGVNGFYDTAHLDCI